MNLKSLIAKTAILLGALLISVSAYSLDSDADAEPQKEPAEKAEASDSSQERHISQQMAGHPAKANLGEQATNPVAPLLSFRLQNGYTSSYRNADGYGNVFTLQMVIPAEMPWKTVPEMLTRVTIPYITTPDVNGQGHKTGTGDTSMINFFVTEWLPKGQVLAIGPAWTIPTAGDNEATGSGQWQVGPNMVYLNTNTPKLQWGFLAFQQWSFSKTRDNAKSVSTFNIQPIATKHFNKGWYIGPPDIAQIYDFKNDTVSYTHLRAHETTSLI